MNYNFKRFKETAKRVERRITITKSNTIGFPTQFCKDHDISQFEYVNLYYDQAKKAIGICFTKDKIAGSLILRESFHKKSGKRYGYYISASVFFKINHIDVKTYHGRYEFQKKPMQEVFQAGKGHLYIIHLNDKTLKLPKQTSGDDE